MDNTIMNIHHYAYEHIGLICLGCFPLLCFVSVQVLPVDAFDADYARFPRFAEARVSKQECFYAYQ